jgi:membrane protease subunit (stomatin/prohibitin family)
MAIVDVIEFLDDTGNVLVKRLPDKGQLEIIWGSQLTVRESQEAVFFRDGKALDVFGAGRHILKTQNVPIVGKWVTWFGYGENSPFRSEVLFIGKQLFSNLKWGTKDPILFRDTELQVVRLRSFGSYSIRVIDSMLFVNKVVGTKGLFTTSSVEDYLRGIIVSKLNSILARELTSVLDISKNIETLNMIIRTELQTDFNGLGLQVHDFYIQSVSVPDEVQKIIDSKSGMSVLGNLDQYMKFKIANAIGDAANNESTAGSMVGLGAGMGMGMNFPNYIQESMQPQHSQPITEKLKNLKELLDLGAITQQEFDNKKSELLKQI